MSIIINIKKRKMKLNFFKIKNGIVRHKQIEKRDNMLFMRLKKRPVIIVKNPDGGI